MNIRHVYFSIRGLYWAWKVTSHSQRLLDLQGEIGFGIWRGWISSRCFPTPPRRLTKNLKIMVWKMNFLFQGAHILRFQPLIFRGVGIGWCDRFCRVLNLNWNEEIFRKDGDIHSRCSFRKFNSQIHCKLQTTHSFSECSIYIEILCWYCWWSRNPAPPNMNETLYIWVIYHIKWCRISSINSISVLAFDEFLFVASTSGGWPVPFKSWRNLLASW